LPRPLAAAPPRNMWPCRILKAWAPRAKLARSALMPAATPILDAGCGWARRGLPARALGRWEAAR